MELRTALQQNQVAQANFEKFPSPRKRGILEWIKETVRLAQINLKANFPVSKSKQLNSS